MTAFEPGTVATATVRGVPDVRVMWTDTGNGWVSERRMPGDVVWHRGDLVTDVRPLAAIDPEDPEQVARLVKLLTVNGWTPTRSHGLRDALREYANPTPPKPAEPTGLGAVVEDSEGLRWVRASLTTTVKHWRSSVDTGMGRRAYDDIDAVRVLSEGVTA